jgi:hypothetical protein
MNTLNIWMMIVGLELLLVIVLIIVGVVLLLRNKNQREDFRESPSEIKIINSNKTIKSEKKRSKSVYTGPSYRNVRSANIDYGDATTVLSKAALNPVEDGATTILDSNDMVQAVSLGKLTRKNTNETIEITKSDFSVGKDRMHADYCISNNRAISRQHVVFTRGKNGTYVKDCNSTNGSWINGIKLQSERQVLLNDGDVLKLANEEFIYGA